MVASGFDVAQDGYVILGMQKHSWLLNSAVLLDMFGTAEGDVTEILRQDCMDKDLRFEKRFRSVAIDSSTTCHRRCSRQ